MQCVVFLAVMLLVVMSCCSAVWGKAASGEPYVIGAIFAITGDASSLGVPEKNTAVMLEKQINAAGGINGRPLKIVIEDNRGDPAEALNAARRLVERDNVLAIIGPSRTGDTMAIKAYMDKAGVPLLSCAAGIDIVEPVAKYVFKTPQSDRMAVQKIIGYLKSKKITRVATLSDSTAFGKGGLQELRALLPKAGINLVTTEEYGPKDSSMETQVTKIRGTDAQAVICWGTPPGPAIVAKNMKQMGVSLPLICSHGVANATFLRLAGSAAEGVVLPAGRLIVVDQIPTNHPQAKLLRDYTIAYQKTYRTSVDTFGGHAWDAVKLIANALRVSGPDRDNLRAELEKTKGFVGTAGIFSFSPSDHNGLNTDAFVMVQVRKGKWSLLK
jgi:branched-chain amino acid transport system substrate-binding protein